MFRCFAVFLLTISAIEDHVDETGCALQVREAAMELMETASQSDDSSRSEITDEMRAPPQALDWSTKGVTTAVKDTEQGECGSCWAFSTVANPRTELEGIEPGMFMTSIEAGPFLWGGSDEKDCYGGDLPTAFDYVERDPDDAARPDIAHPVGSKTWTGKELPAAGAESDFKYSPYFGYLPLKPAGECTLWLADKAKAYNEFEVFRQQMAAHGYQRAIPIGVKIGAYCPTITADTTLTFLDTPCEDRNQVLQECTKGLRETCKFRRGAMMRMMNFVRREFQNAKRQLPKKQQRLFQSNWNVLKQPIADAIKSVNCNTNINELADSFEELQTEFADGLRALDSAMGFTQRRK